MDEVEIYEQELSGGGKFTILRGVSTSEKPNAYMDKAVETYCNDESHNTFVENHPDNPYVRVIIKGINDLPFVPLHNQTL